MISSHEVHVSGVKSPFVPEKSPWDPLTYPSCLLRDKSCLTVILKCGEPCVAAPNRFSLSLFNSGCKPNIVEIRISWTTGGKMAAICKTANRNLISLWPFNLGYHIYYVNQISLNSVKVEMFTGKMAAHFENGWSITYFHYRHSTQSIIFIL